ncbi:unnamed protein product [Orchesella dallaii]|uniref:F-box domain-containing protein n=1 Tax=Orchesella dallaii TaxID=48710 RepID=A0ABP1RZY8_9HEXA
MECSNVQKSGAPFTSPKTTPVLPPETWTHIFQFLGPGDLYSVTIACPEWNELLEEKRNTFFLPLVIHSAPDVAFIHFSEGLFFACGQIVFCFTKYIVFTGRLRLIELFNLLLDFEKVNFPASIPLSKSGHKTLVKVTQAVALFYAIIAGICYFLMMWNFPCQLVPLAYFTMPECLNTSYHGGWSINSTFQLMTFCILVMWLFVDNAEDFALFFVHFTLVQSYCLYRYIQLVDKLIAAKPKEALKHLPLYRQIQILNHYYNINQKHDLLIAHEYIMVFGVIISFFALISLGTEAFLPQFMLHSLNGFDAAIVLLVCNSIMGQMYSASKQFCRKTKDQILSNHLSGVQRRWIQRYLKSCAVLKCNVGDVNFIEELTPLVMLDFCINQIVSLLLLQK